MSYDPGSQENGQMPLQGGEGGGMQDAYAIPSHSQQMARVGNPPSQPVDAPQVASKAQPQASATVMVGGLPVGAAGLDPNREQQKGRWLEEEEEELQRFAPVYLDAGKGWDEISQALTKRRSALAARARFAKIAETNEHLSQYVKKSTRTKSKNPSSRGSTPSASQPADIPLKDESVEYQERKVYVQYNMPQSQPSTYSQPQIQDRASYGGSPPWDLEEDARLVAAVTLRGEDDIDGIMREMQPTTRTAQEVTTRYFNATRNLHIAGLKLGFWDVPIPQVFEAVRDTGMDMSEFRVPVVGPPTPQPPAPTRTSTLHSAAAGGTPQWLPPQQQQLRRTISADPPHPSQIYGNAGPPSASLDQFSLSHGRGGGVGRPSPLSYSATAGGGSSGDWTGYGVQSAPRRFDLPPNPHSSASQYTSPAPASFGRQISFDYNTPLSAGSIPIQNRVPSFAPPVTASTPQRPRLNQSPDLDDGRSVSSPGGSRPRSSRAASQKAGSLMHKLAKESERDDEEDERAMRRKRRAASETSPEVDEAVTPADGIPVRGAVKVKQEGSDDEAEVGEEEDSSEGEEFSPRKSKRLKTSAGGKAKSKAKVTE